MPVSDKKNNQKSVTGWVKYSQNATLVFISAYSIYVFLGKITIPQVTLLYHLRYLFWVHRGDLKVPLENMVASLRSHARFRVSLFSPFSHSLLPPPAAVALQAPDLLEPTRLNSVSSYEKTKDTVRCPLFFGCGEGI